MTDTSSAGERFDDGLATRKAVLGDEYVEKSLANAGEFGWPLQKLTTEYCWNEIWNRPGLDRRARSLLNLGMIAALNRPHEFRIHVNGALNNGLSKEEIREAILQIAFYCGGPAALDANRILTEVLKERGEL
ncbi:carboxymuconolactone decarboxylase family protein [Psychromarinibacter sp. C21-152]|uniref:Carboxymuconolactone decarboxylase family protein n=1 Tax=Psychromarinibacter sediminicola TaxID=3033385 RepID=A0AAE3NRT8_9RHOB|nr:carboxymuconolactone decarboxylase family protein [Psychromarinibacter sediminicola]MDF0601266.1 carboxymuconolactone decarboxylase family protein [Psychromarinibacter sediminicola]